jgi:hypothetical protein
MHECIETRSCIPWSSTTVLYIFQQTSRLDLDDPFMSRHLALLDLGDTLKDGPRQWSQTARIGRDLHVRSSVFQSDPVNIAKITSVSVDDTNVKQRKDAGEPLDGAQDRRRSRAERFEDLALLRSLDELFERDRSFRDGQPEVGREVWQPVRVGLGISVSPEQGQDRVSLRVGGQNRLVSANEST